MGFEDEAEQSLGRPCRQCDGRSKRTYDLTSSIVPRGTSFHRSVEFEFPPIGLDAARFSCCCCGLFSGPAELGAVNPYAVHDHSQPARQGHDRLFHPTAPLLARRAQHGDPEMAWHKMDAFDAVRAGVLATEEIEAVRGRMPEHVFRELYMAEASDDEGNPFGIDHIRACVQPKTDGRPYVWGWDWRSVGTGPSALRSTGRDAGWTSTASRNRGARPSRRTITHIPLAPWSEA